MIGTVSTVSVQAPFLKKEGPIFSRRTTTGYVEVYDRITQIDLELWDAVYPSTWKSYAYYSCLDETFAPEVQVAVGSGSNFQSRYLILKDEEGIVRIVQPFFLVEQDLTISIPQSLQNIFKFLRKFRPSFLRQKILMVGSMVSDGRIGVPDCEVDLPQIFEQFNEALEMYAECVNASLIVLKDLPTFYRKTLIQLSKSLYTRIPSWPAVGLDLSQFKNFEDYLQNHLAKSTRKSLRRKFRDLEQRQIAPITLEVKSTLTDYESARVYQLYRDTACKSEVQFEIYSSDYFKKLGEKLSDKTRFFLWKQNEKIVAFTFCVIDGDTLYDNDIGLDYDVAHDLHLYYITFRDLINWSIANGCKNYYSSPCGYHPKLLLRLKLVPYDLYVRSLSSWIQPIFGWMTKKFHPTRSEPLLKQFANASSLWEDN